MPDRVRELPDPLVDAIRALAGQVDALGNAIGGIVAELAKRRKAASD